MENNSTAQGQPACAAGRQKKNNSGCLVGCIVAAGLTLLAGAFFTMLAGAIIASAANAAGRAQKAGAAADSPEEETLPRLVWERGGSAESPVVLRLRLGGVIAFEDERNDFLGIREKSPSSILLKRIRQATMDDEVAGICLELDTPGGEVTAADVITDALWQFKNSATNRFVVVHMGSLCCSGGYYIASAANCIIAHPTTTTGSIGVIMSTYNAAELARKIGVESVAITTGGNKNLLDPLKPVQPEHVEIFKRVIAADYDRFVNIVAAGRDLPPDEVRKIADGRILSADDAYKLKLIDGIGYRDTVDDAIAKLAGEEAKICRYEDDKSVMGLLSEIFSACSPSHAAAEAVKAAIAPAAAPKIEYRLR